MNISGLFQLEKTAKSKGGDRYYGRLEDDHHIEDSRIYVPQCISRNRLKTPSKRIRIVIQAARNDKKFEAVERNSGVSVLCKLSKQAKASGGDRYDGTYKDEAIAIYVPQQFVRVRLNGRPEPAVSITFHPQVSRLSGDTSASSSSSSVSTGLVPAVDLPVRKKIKVDSALTASTAVAASKLKLEHERLVDGDKMEEKLSRQDLPIRKSRIRVIYDDDDEDDSASVIPITQCSKQEIDFDVASSWQPEISFEAYVHKNDDDSVIRDISDADGNFNLQTYLMTKIAQGEEHSQT